MRQSIPHLHVAIVGAGFAGLGMAIRLRRDGVEDFAVFEEAGEVGGTWRDNSYPGSACDVPSHVYSFSFAPHPGWTRMFAPQPEIWAYLRECVRRSGIAGHLRLNTRVTGATWDSDRRCWRIETSRGPVTADALVAAAGGLAEPSVPDLPGLDRFAGAAFHSARWDHDTDLAGRRVAVIGTGTSAAQFVPEIAPRAAALYVFQRTAPWVLPRRNRGITGLERRAYRAAPVLQQLARGTIGALRETLVVNNRHPRLARLLVQRIAARHLRRSVPDPALRARLTPGYTVGCKRIVLSNEYLPALTRPNVEVLTEPITEVRPHAVVTADGVERSVDVLIFGTGFQVSDPPIAHRIRGLAGRTLAQQWSGSPTGHLGTMVAGFPNLFLMLGPNTGLGHSSVVLMMEAQHGHVLDALRFLRERGYAALSPRADVQAAYTAEMDTRLAGTVWNAGGCRSWYLDAAGRNWTMWPGTSWAFRRRLARFQPDDYDVVQNRSCAMRGTP